MSKLYAFHFPVSECAGVCATCFVDISATLVILCVLSAFVHVCVCVEVILMLEYAEQHANSIHQLHQ